MGDHLRTGLTRQLHSQLKSEHNEKKTPPNQKEHHRKQTFKEELLQFLDEYEIDYDERYLWN